MPLWYNSAICIACESISHRHVHNIYHTSSVCSSLDSCSFLVCHCVCVCVCVLCVYCVCVVCVCVVCVCIMQTWDLLRIMFFGFKRLVQCFQSIE